MGKSGKRKNASVDTQVAVDVLGEELRAGQLRSNPQNLDDESLFVEDTQPDDAQIHLPTRLAKRPRASKQKRMTKAQEIISANQPLPLAPVSTRTKRIKRKGFTRSDISRCGVEEPRINDGVVREDAWAAVDSTADWADSHAPATRPKSIDTHNRPQISAVEVDPGGCSYNPDQVLHQDVVAQAVAAEYLKEIDKEIQPKAPPLQVTEEQFALSEMAIGLFDYDSPGDDNDNETGPKSSDKQNKKRKTIKDRVRQHRQKQMEKEHDSKRELKRLRRELDSLPQLTGSLTAHDEALAARRARRKADVDDRQAHEPPKLGRLRFMPQPTQVLASDEVTGSLRKLKTVPVIAKDRFKSLQKRGLIHVTVKQHRAKPSARRIKRFEKKATQETNERNQREIQNIKQKRLLAERR